MPLLLTLDPSKKYDVVFSYDPEKQAWQIRFEERPDEPETGKADQAGKSGKRGKQNGQGGVQ